MAILAEFRRRRIRRAWLDTYNRCTGPDEDDDLPDEAPVLAAAARRPRRFRRV